MDAAQALAELTELSSQIRSAVVLGADGSVLGSTTGDAGTAEGLARATLELVAAAAELSSSDDVTRVEVELDEGGLFVLCEGDRTIAATTGSQPTAGLVTYDLRTCLRDIDEPESNAKRASRTSKDAAE